MDGVESEKSALAIRRLTAFDMDKAAEVSADDLIFDTPGVEAVAAECAGIVLASESAGRAETLLVAGAPCVYVGEAALRDSEALARLAQAHPGQIGIYAPVRRQPVSWSFVTDSNADFKTVAPSVCEPSWEVLKADGTPTGTHAGWWLKAMRDLGAAHFLVQAEVRDDADLNILAGLVEDLGASLWVAPRAGEGLPLSDWVAYGQCRQLALPDREYARRAELLGDFLQPMTAPQP
jgi:hypothetical protein